MLHTQRLLLRSIEAGDLADIHAYSREAHVGPAAGWKPHESLDETRAFMDTFGALDGVFAIVLTETGRVIGTIGLVADARRPLDDVRMLGYAMGEAYWGRGYMTEVARAVLRFGFEERGLALVSAYCYPHNVGSARVLDKCGFTREGCLRRSERLWDGTVLDEYAFSLTREEWRALNT